MKKILTAVCVLAGTFYGTAQETKFGVRAGVDLATVEQTATVGGLTVSGKASETGFFVGGFASIGITESFAVQPEVLYVAIKDFNMLTVPVLGKYAVAEKIHLMAGPSFNYLLDAEEDEFKLNVDFNFLVFVLKCKATNFLVVFFSFIIFTTKMVYDVVVYNLLIYQVIPD
ncbi:hypothetical protein [Flavobacterium sp.]|jgi:hypothetical protein|uniref:hypothetical protein n=1 Tax=Flavobacterium sp. TaxID=239 RepID=UPI0037BEF8BC